MIRVLYGVAVVLVVIWLIGILVKVTFAAFHLLLVIAVAILLWNLIVGRRRVY